MREGAGQKRRALIARLAGVTSVASLVVAQSFSLRLHQGPVCRRRIVPLAGLVQLTKGMAVKRIVLAAVSAAGALLVLTGCGGSSTPTGTAAALLGKAGATSDGPAYIVTSSDADAVCNNGAAEADGAVQLHGGASDTVNVCVFPSNDQLESDLQAGQYAAGSDVIQVGQTTLVFVSGNTSDDSTSGFVTSMGESVAGGMQIASKVGGTVIPAS